MKWAGRAADLLVFAITSSHVGCSADVPAVIEDCAVRCQDLRDQCVQQCPEPAGDAQDTCRPACSASFDACTRSCGSAATVVDATAGG
jgi:hypothetical protein